MKKTNKVVAKMAVKHTLDTMTGTNWDRYRNKKTSWEFTREEQYLDPDDICLYGFLKPLLYEGFKFRYNNLNGIRKIAEISYKSGCGNCGEMAAVAFDFVYKQGVRPLEFMSLHGNDHAFICLGRDLNSELLDCSTWGENCFISDPWAAGFRKHIEFGYYSGKDFDNKMEATVPSFIQPKVYFCLESGF